MGYRFLEMILPVRTMVALSESPLAPQCLDFAS
jgi:hypothetical protein